MVQVITYGYGYDLWRFLNGIVIYLGGNEFSGLIFTVAVMAVAVGMLTVRRINPFTYFSAIWLPALLYVALFTSTTTVMITDQQYGAGVPAGNWSVNNVPLGLAYPLSIVTRVEDLIVQAIDNNLAPVNHTYHRFGLLGEVSLIQALESNNYLEDPYMYQTALAYMNDCVLPAFASGDIDPLAFKYSPDLLSSIALNYNALFSKVYSPAHPTGQVMTCSQVYNVLSGQVNAAAMSIAPNSGVDRLANKTEFARLYRTPAEVASMLNDVGAAYFNGAQTGADMLKQSFMVSVLRSMTGIPALTPATASARQNFVSTVATTTQMYIEMLPTLNAIIHLVIVLLFPFVGMFFIIQSAKPFIAWIFGLAWVSMWQPIQALVQAIMAGYLSQSITSLTATTGGFSLGNLWMIATKTGHSFMVAGLILMSTPTIAAMIFSWMGVRTTSMLFASEALRGNVRLAGSRGASDALDPRAAKGMGNTIREHDFLAAASMQAANAFSDRAMRQWRSWYTDPRGGAYGQRRGDIKSDMRLPWSNTYKVSNGRYSAEYAMKGTGESRFLNLTEVSTGRSVVEATVAKAMGVSESHGLTKSESTRLSNTASHGGTSNLTRSTGRSVGTSFKESKRDGHSEQVGQNTNQGIVYSQKVDRGLGDARQEDVKNSTSLEYAHKGANEHIRRETFGIDGKAGGSVSGGGGLPGGLSESGKYGGRIGASMKASAEKIHSTQSVDTRSESQSHSESTADQTSRRGGITAVVGLDGKTAQSHSTSDSVSSGKDVSGSRDARSAINDTSGVNVSRGESARYERGTSAKRADMESRAFRGQVIRSISQAVVDDPRVQKAWNDFMRKTHGHGSYQPFIKVLEKVAEEKVNEYRAQSYQTFGSQARNAFDRVRVDRASNFAAEAEAAAAAIARTANSHEEYIENARKEMERLYEKYTGRVGLTPALRKKIDRILNDSYGEFAKTSGNVLTSPGIQRKFKEAWLSSVTRMSDMLDMVHPKREIHITPPPSIRNRWKK